MQTNADEISPDDILYRRLRPDAVEDDGSLNSLTFYLRSGEDGVSADLARKTTPEKTMEPMPSFGLGEIRVRDILDLGLIIEPDPQPDNPAHVLIKGNFTQGTRRRLARATKLVKQPTVKKNPNVESS